MAFSLRSTIHACELEVIAARARLDGRRIDVTIGKRLLQTHESMLTHLRSLSTTFDLKDCLRQRRLHGLSTGLSWQHVIAVPGIRE